MRGSHWPAQRLEARTRSPPDRPAGSRRAGASRGRPRRSRCAARGRCASRTATACTPLVVAVMRAASTPLQHRNAGAAQAAIKRSPSQQRGRAAPAVRAARASAGAPARCRAPPPPARRPSRTAMRPGTAAARCRGRRRAGRSRRPATSARSAPRPGCSSRQLQPGTGIRRSVAPEQTISASKGRPAAAPRRAGRAARLRSTFQASVSAR